MTELGSHLESEMGSDWLFWKSFVSLCLGKLRDEEILPFFFFYPRPAPQGSPGMDCVVLRGEISENNCCNFLKYIFS